MKRVITAAVLIPLVLLLLLKGSFLLCRGCNGIGGRTCCLGISLHRRVPRVPTHSGSDRHRGSLRRDLLQPGSHLAGARPLQLVLVLVCSFRSPLERVLPDTAFSIFPLLYIGLTLATLPLLWVQAGRSLAR